MERVAVELSGVSETLLGNLARRAAAAQRRRPLLHDPHAVDLVAQLDYDFAASSGGVGSHAARVEIFDAAVRRFQHVNPSGTVVALGEGLETQFWRVDNGRLRWLTVDLPEVIGLRARLLPDGDRQHSYAGSALDLAWLDEVDPATEVIVTAQGLLPYLQRDQVHALIAGVAQRRPGSAMVIDVVPERMRELVAHAPGRESELARQHWTWLFNSHERAALATIPGVTTVRDLRPPLHPDATRCLLSVVRQLPRRLRYELPVIPVLQLSF
jgi:O-methyltransferase involved in polyketide biosynthesis